MKEIDTVGRDSKRIGGKSDMWAQTLEKNGTASITAG